MLATILFGNYYHHFIEIITLREMNIQLLSVTDMSGNQFVMPIESKLTSHFLPGKI